MHIIGQGGDNDLLYTFFVIIDEKRQKVQIDARTKSGSTPLHLASGRGNQYAIEVLLSKGANPNLADAEGLTPLHVICNRQDNDDVLLNAFFELNEEIRYMVQIDAQDNKGWTPLHYALDNNCKKLVEFLLRNGADSNLADEDGSSPLHFVCKSCCSDDLVEMFFEVNDDARRILLVDARNKLGNTPLHWALHYGHKKAAELLLRRGANPNLTNANDVTPLQICLQKEDDDLMNIFFKINDEIQQMVQVNTQDKFGCTPIERAVETLQPRVVNILLDHDADLSCFAFPSKRDFTNFILRRQLQGINFKLRLASGMLAIVDSLNKRGYELDRSAAMAIMKLFLKYGLLVKSECLEEVLLADEGFASTAKETMIIPDLSIYDLIQLPTEEEKKRLTYMDYFDFARSKKLCELPASYQNVGSVYLCEKLSRRFFRRWALDPFWEMIRYRLPILCCKIIIEKLKNQDLWHICLAAKGQNSWRR
uniref:Uncharacterized protein n=1 Tax=Trichogramma kaykai TaxID=54128 RepID=A0ABD2WWN9_9HYME